MSTLKPETDYNPVSCDHKHKNGFSSWSFQSEESCNFPGAGRKVAVYVCYKCGEIRIAGRNDGNSFDEHFDIHHPEALRAIIKNANWLNEKELFIEASESALKLQQAQQYITQLKEVLRFADCPELIIENPTFIKGKKPTDEDMQWARQQMAEHKKKKDDTWDNSLAEHYGEPAQSLEQENERLRVALKNIIKELEYLDSVAAIRRVNSIATTALNPKP